MRVTGLTCKDLNMTTLDVVFRYVAPPTEGAMRAVDSVREVYGIRRIHFNEKEHTLRVEFDASRRAKIILQQMGIVQPGEEVAGVNKVLNAAALTYVAAFIATLGNLLWLMSVRDRR